VPDPGRDGLPAKWGCKVNLRSTNYEKRMSQLGQSLLKFASPRPVCSASGNPDSERLKTVAAVARINRHYSVDSGHCNSYVPEILLT